MEVRAGKKEDTTNKRERSVWSGEEGLERREWLDCAMEGRNGRYI